MPIAPSTAGMGRLLLPGDVNKLARLIALTGIGAGPAKVTLKLISMSRKACRRRGVLSNHRSRLSVDCGRQVMVEGVAYLIEPPADH